MATTPSWVPVLALLVSLVSLFLSAYVMLTNRQFLKAKVKTDLLTKIAEARVKYKELNRRFRQRANRTSPLSESDIKMLAEYAQFEKNTERYLDEVKNMNLSAAEMESYRQSIEGMLLSIEHDLKLCDECDAKDEAIRKNAS